MKGSLSLAEELRAIRGGVNPKGPSKRTDQPTETEHPWKSDIERVEHTLQEALQAISQFSGVELPEGVGKAGDEDSSLSRLDCATLKDRIRNDLEAFSVTTVSEMAKQAEEKARTALSAIQNEMSNHIEQVIGECRLKVQEQLEPQEPDVDVTKVSQERVAELVRSQTDEFARWVWLTCKGTGTPIPLQIEKLLEPHVEEATALVTGSIQQKIQDLLAEQEKVVEERFQGAADSLQNRITTLEQAAQQICEKNADSVTSMSTERLNAAADEAVQNFEGRIQDKIEGSFDGIQTRLDETTAGLLERLHQEQDQRAHDFIRRMEALASEVEATKGSELSARMEQTAARTMESSLQQLQQTTEGALQQIQDAGRTVNESVEQGMARVAEMLGGEGQDLSGLREKVLSDSREQVSSMVQEAMGSLEPRVLQLAEEKIEAASTGLDKSQDETILQFESRLQEISEGQYNNLLERIQKDAGEASTRAAEEVRNASGSAMQELSEKVDHASSLLTRQQEEANSRFESSMNDTLESFQQQLAEITRVGLEEQRKTIADTLTHVQDRLKQAAEVLVADPDPDTPSDE
jgi:flagellar biosynthesis chaperone FliJ